MPQRVFTADAPWPLHDVARSRAIEAQALARHEPHVLMARAGQAVARLALAVAPSARRTVVLAGPGNNGGDGVVAARLLHRHGHAVQVQLLADPDHLPPDATRALQQAQQASVPIAGAGALPADTDLLIDGLLGLGASRAPTHDVAAAIDRANASGRPVLAIDLPSGLHADTGQLLGGSAIRATWTLSLLTLKPGLFTAMGRDLCGDVWFDDLAVAMDAPGQAELGAARHAPAPGFAVRQHAQHKGSFGDLTVVGGASGMQGAAVLAARAALTAGAGRVYLRLLAEPAPAGLPAELMLSPPAWLTDASALRRSTVACGCGGGPVVADALPSLLDHAARLLLDADALNAVAASATLRLALVRRGHRGDTTVLTPHPLEAARLLFSDAVAVQADRLAAAQALADSLGSIVLLKGSGSVVAAPGRRPWINASGNAALAAPGSGDVLAGWIAGLWAQQGADPANGGWFAARAGAWLHGRAVDRRLALQPGLAAVPVRAGDLPDLMIAALR